MNRTEDQASTATPKSKAKFWGWMGGIATGVLIVVIGGWINYHPLGIGRNDVTEVQSAGSTSLAPVQDARETTPPATSEPSSTDGQATGTSPVDRLTIDSAVANERCANYSWQSGPGEIGGQPYAFGFACEINSTRAAGYLEYRVPRSATHFTATVGQPDDVTNTTVVIRFEVLDVVSGAVLAVEDVAYDQSAVINAPVDGVSRIRLQVSVLTFDIEPKIRDGAGAGWMEPHFR